MQTTLPMLGCNIYEWPAYLVVAQFKVEVLDGSAIHAAPVAAKESM